MSKLTKNQKVAEAKVDSHRQYKLTEACALVKEVSYTKFDASVELSVRLGVDPRKANQMVRGVVTLPHGTGKVTRVLVLCTPDKEAEAQEAGAELIVTTEKDAVKIPKLPRNFLPAYFLRVEITILRGHEEFNRCIAQICLGG